MSDIVERLMTEHAFRGHELNGDIYGIAAAEIARLRARIAALTVRDGETLDETDPRYLAQACARLLAEVPAERDELQSDRREVRQDYTALQQNREHDIARLTRERDAARAELAALRAAPGDVEWMTLELQGVWDAARDADTHGGVHEEKHPMRSLGRHVLARITSAVAAEREKLAQAVEALEFYGGHDPDNSDHGDWVERMNEDGGDVARDALAAIRAGGDNAGAASKPEPKRWPISERWNDEDQG